MNPSRRQLNTLLGASLLSLGTAPLAWAQSAAGQAPLKLIVPFTPGTGIDLIALGWKPGPRFKEVLDAVQTRQLEGALLSREQALDWIKKEHP